MLFERCIDDTRAYFGNGFNYNVLDNYTKLGVNSIGHTKL